MVRRALVASAGLWPGPFQAIGYGLNGQMLIQQREIETGVELLQSSLATLSAERYELYATELNGALAQGLAMMGRRDQALLTIDKTIASLERHGELFMPETGFGITLAQQSQAEASFPGVAFRKVDETNARVEFSLAWSPQSECAVIGRFLASMRASAADKGVDASAS